jgi:hypothetical protein
METKKDVDWELKDRRTAWENINTACSKIVAARIEAGLFKPKDNKEAMKELRESIQIEFSDFLTIWVGTPSGGEEKTPAQKEEIKNEAPKQEVKWFCSSCGKGVTERVKTYSEDKLGFILCYNCQKKREENIENAHGPEDLAK